MCGIVAAIWSEADLALSESELAAMTAALAHRGPDDSGIYLAPHKPRGAYPATPGVALGHRRLAILDLAGGRQPMHNEDRSVRMVANGEIYNYRDLRRRLEGGGHRFASDCDSEVIVHLYEDEGLDCFALLDGMFAIAIWDAPRRRLVLARDRMGQKPLVYRREAGRLIAASEIKSLLCGPGGRPEIDPAAVDEFLLYQYVPHPNTIYRGIRKLPPGHLAVAQDDSFEVRPFWRPDFQDELHADPAELKAEVERRLASAVAARRQSDVPLGAFLSGGVDSSLVTALLQQECGEPVKTFSVGFEHDAYDETRHARRVAEHLGTEHHELVIESPSAEEIARLAVHYDEPFADSSAYPTWRLAEFARREVTVALSGDGGDELFAGYDRYKAVRLAARLDRLPWLRAAFGARFWQRLPGRRQRSLLRRAKRFSESLRQNSVARYGDWVSIFRERQRAELYTDGFLESLPDSDPLDFLDQAWRKSEGRDPVTRATLTDLQTYLPCDLMTKVDIATMAHGLECRQPFLDHHLVQYAARIPAGYKLRGRRGKWILEQTFRGRLPPEIWRRRKMGFGAPVSEWLRGPLRPLAREILLDAAAASRAYLRRQAVQRLLDEHDAGRYDHGARLWALLVFEFWLRG